MTKKTTEAGIDFDLAAEQAITELGLAESDFFAADEDDDTFWADREEIENPSEVDSATTEEEDDSLFNDLEDGEANTQLETELDLSQQIEVDGSMRSLEEIVKGYLRQSDYTQKTQELARERDEFADARALWDAIKENPLETVKRMAVKAGLINDRTIDTMNVNLPNVPVTTTEEVKKLISEAINDALGNNPTLKRVEQDTLRNQVDNAFVDLESKFDVKLNEKDRLAILRKAQASGTADLELVFSGLLKQVEMRKAQREAVKKTSSVRANTANKEAEALPEVLDFWDAVKVAAAELKATI